MNKQTRLNREPYYRSQSTLLIPEAIFKRYFWRSPYIKIGHWALASYFASLMEDPQLEYKISFLEGTGKWKKQYQAQGQSMVRVNFYPDEQGLGEAGCDFECYRLFSLLYLRFPDADRHAGDIS
jgi:hypothetical protein